jgi:hypothetical protein
MVNDVSLYGTLESQNLSVDEFWLVVVPKPSLLTPYTIGLKIRMVSCTSYRVLHLLTGLKQLLELYQATLSTVGSGSVGRASTGSHW